MLNFHLAVVSSSKFNILGCQHMASQNEECTKSCILGGVTIFSQTRDQRVNTARSQTRVLTFSVWVKGASPEDKGRTKIMKIQDPNAALNLTALGVQGEIEILCLCCHTIRDLNGSKVSRHGHENPATREGTDSKIHKDPIVYRQTMQDQLQHCSGTSSAGGMTSRKDSCRWDQLEL